ncbi:MAG TPA: zinc ribbon domain-containing protein [Gemmatimonadaceae bacterium]|nr:zinc ribbon domain-containing protein [Gemmatimonadaceae bacterium]
MVALVVGTLLALGALAFVLYPVFFGTRNPAPVPTVAKRARAADNDESSAVAALRELEFDRATGKLSDADYAELKARYTKSAIAAMRAAGPGGETVGRTIRPTDAEVEAIVLTQRQRLAGCPACGPRPESDAVYCSNCGRYLNDRCATCGAPVVALEARYCNTCGHRLAA